MGTFLNQMRNYIVVNVVWGVARVALDFCESILHILIEFALADSLAHTIG